MPVKFHGFQGPESPPGTARRHIVTIGVGTHRLQIGDEEVDCTALYRDPVHDFGFLRFDVSALRFGVPPAIKLRPEACRVGTDIRIIGNDAGERRQVLAGTIARLDRNTPEYGRMSWNDANTFYVGAASNTSGGSSGSPVLDIRGDAIAINAGGATSAASAMYLPLWPAVRALGFIRRGEYVPRGDCHAVFEHKRFHEALRAGVPTEVVAAVKDTGMREHIAAGGSETDADAGATGMLQVSHVLKGGVSARGSKLYDRIRARKGFLQTGDVIFKVEGRVLSAFWPLEQAMDATMEELHSGAKRRAEADAVAPPRPGRDAAADGDEGAEEDDESDSDDEGSSRPWTGVLRSETQAGGEDEDDGDEDAFSRALVAGAQQDRSPPTADSPESAAAHPAAASHGREALGTLRMTIVRAGRVMEIAVPTVDAHALVPRRVLQIGGAGLAEVSVCRAMRNGQPQGLVVINPPGFVFADVGSDVVLRSVDGNPVTCLADAAAALAVVPEDSYFTVSVSDLHSPSGAARSSVCYMTRRFHPCRILSRHTADDCAADGSGASCWLETPMPDPGTAPGTSGAAATSVGDDNVSLPGTGPTLHPDARGMLAAAVLESLGEFDMSADAMGGGGMADEAEAEEGSEDGDDSAGEQNSEDGMAIELDAGALLAAAASDGGPEARGALESALRDAMGPDVDAGEVMEELLSQLRRSAGGKVHHRSPGSGIKATEEDSKALAEAVKAQRMVDLEDAPGPVKDAAMALVAVECRLPLPVDGVETAGFAAMLGLGGAADGKVSSGRGFLVDKGLGIFMVDRSVVPTYMAICHIVVGVSRVPARVLFVSPSGTFSLVQADLTGAAEGSGIRLADTLRAIPFGPDELGLRDLQLERKAAKRAGAAEAVWFLGLDEAGGVDVEKDDCFQSCRNVAQALPEYGGQAFEAFRVVNSVVFDLSAAPGVAVNRKGELVAMVSDLDGPAAVSAEWLKEPVMRVIERIRTGASATLNDLGVQLEFVALSDAQAAFGMPAGRAAAMMNHTVGSQVLVVSQVVAGASAGDRFGLRERDVLLDVLPDTWPEPDDAGDGDERDETEPATPAPAGKPAAAGAAGHAGGVLGPLMAALGLGPAAAPVPTFKDDLTAPLPIRSVADVVLRCRLRSSVRLRVLRRGREVCVTARTDPVDVRGASKVVVQWQGMTMTAPDVGLLRRGGVPWVGVPSHRGGVPHASWTSGNASPRKPTATEATARALSVPALGAARSSSAQDEGVHLEARLPAGVVCCFCESGSEASSELGQAYWVLRIGDTPVPTLDDVMYVTSRVPDHAPVTVTVGEILNGQTKIITLRPDSATLPLQRFVHGARFQWRREHVRGPWTPGGTGLQRQSSLSSGIDAFADSGTAPTLRAGGPAPTDDSQSAWSLATVAVAGVAAAAVVGVLLARRHQVHSQPA